MNASVVMTTLAAVGSIPSCRYILPNLTANRYTKSRNAAGRYSCFRAASSSSHLNVCWFPVCCCIICRLSISYSLLISGVHSVNSLGNRLGVHTVHSQCSALNTSGFCLNIRAGLLQSGCNAPCRAASFFQNRSQPTLPQFPLSCRTAASA